MTKTKAIEKVELNNDQKKAIEVISQKLELSEGETKKWLFEDDGKFYRYRKKLLDIKLLDLIDEAVEELRGKLKGGSLGQFEKGSVGLAVLLEKVFGKTDKAQNQIALQQNLTLNVSPEIKRIFDGMKHPSETKSKTLKSEANND